MRGPSREVAVTEWLGLRLVVLEGDASLEAFATAFSEVITRRTNGLVRGAVPLEYLARSRVVAVVAKDGELLAGYVIGSTEPLRLLEFVPEEARRKLIPPGGASWSDCCELTCLFRKERLSPLYMSAFVWPRAIRDAIATGRRYMLGGNQSERLDRIYFGATDVLTLYVGPSATNLPSRLLAYPTDRLFRTALRLIVQENWRRLGRRLLALRGRRTKRDDVRAG